MGGKIPREIKKKVIREWIQGIRRDIMAKNNDVGDGTITNIIKDASLQEEYHDMELFRHLAVILKENGLEPVALGFAIRLLRIMEDNGINENQVEPIISDFATYCFKHQISFGTLIQSGYQALSLEEELGVPVKMLPDHITRAKETLDDLLDRSQKQLRMLRDAQSEHETINSRIDEHKVNHPSIAHNMELEKELDETKEKCKDYKQIIKEAEQDIMRLEAANVDKDIQLKAALHQLSACKEKLDKLKKEEANDHSLDDKPKKKMRPADFS
jgi:DNA repair exonuclease SbcCD ATPase subunit